MNNTEKISKKVKIIILILFEFYVISSRTGLYILRLGSSKVTEKPENYSSLLAIFISLSFFYVILGWLMEHLVKYYATRSKRERRFFTWEIWTLILTYICFFIPTVLGDMFLDMGLPISKFVYFVGTTAIMALVWGIYDIRKSSPPELAH